MQPYLREPPPPWSGGQGCDQAVLMGAYDSLCSLIVRFTDFHGTHVQTMNQSPVQKV